MKARSLVGVVICSACLLFLVYTSDVNAFVRLSSERTDAQQGKPPGVAMAHWDLSDIDENGDRVIGPDEGVALVMEVGEFGLSDAQVRDVEAAFQTWEDVSTSYIAFKTAGRLQSPLGLEIDESVDGTNLINIVTPEEQEAGVLDFPEGVLALTIVTFALADGPVEFSAPGTGTVTINVTAGRIVDADMSLNGQFFSPNGEFFGTQDLRATVVHEAGHFLGLEHTPVRDFTIVNGDQNGLDDDGDGVIDNPEESVFFSTIDNGHTPTEWPTALVSSLNDPVQGIPARSLERDDIAGASAIYPTNAPTSFVNSTGRISGRVFTASVAGQGGAPIFGAHVAAFNANNPQLMVLGTLSGASVGNVETTEGGGRFVIEGLEPGDYFVIAEPLIGGLATAGFTEDNLSGLFHDLFLSFVPSVFRSGGNVLISDPENPTEGGTTVTVVAGQTTGGIVFGSAPAQVQPTPTPAPPITQDPVVGLLLLLLFTNAVSNGIGATPVGTPCFIGTATFGSPDSSEVEGLRFFRDAALLTSSFGAAIVGTYYAHSPAVADLIDSSPAIRTASKWLLYPLVYLPHSLGLSPLLYIVGVSSLACLLCAFLKRGRSN